MVKKQTLENALAEIEVMLDAMLLGRSSGNLLDEDSFPLELTSIAKKMNRLDINFAEAQQFTKEIAHGNLNTNIPSKTNYIAGHSKEIHSQLSSFCWSIEQLMEGKMVSKLNYPGELFDSYNNLIGKVSAIFANAETAAPKWGDTVTSWRYHQILSAINQLRIMIIEVSARGEIVFANPLARTVFENIDVMPYNHPPSHHKALLKYLCSFEGCLDNIDTVQLSPKKFPAFYEVYEEDTNDWYKITSDLVKLTDGSAGLLHMIDNISEWKNMERQLELFATIDSLTSAYTRKAGIQKLQELFDQRSDHTHCFAFVDIDELKEINDKFGHNEGDFAIKSISRILLSTIQAKDFLIRYGGDEFLILFTDCPEDKAQEAIKRMYKQLEHINTSLEKEYTLAFSAGITMMTPEIPDMDTLISIADQRMYQNKMKRKHAAEK